MLKFIYLSLFSVLTQLCVAQKPFVGRLEYNLISVDLIHKDTTEGKLFIYALDSLVRYNYLLSDGKKQESIHHLPKHKLLSLIEIDGQFFAIQINDTSKEEEETYHLHKNKKWQHIAGLKCREANLEYSDRNVLLYYAKSIPARYFVGLKGAPGLPVKGQIPTDFGYMAFELQNIDYQQPPFSLFVPDKKYKTLPLKAFLEWSQTGLNSPD
ncbi:MAG: hypothetical protein RIR94_866 [Bacteroidota bacterium]